MVQGPITNDGFAMTPDASFVVFFKDFDGVHLFIHKIRLVGIMNRRTPQKFLLAV